MPGQVPPVTDERDGLTGYLAQQRYVLRLTTFGLTEEQARTPVGPSALSVGGLVKHLASVEESWTGIVQQQAGAGSSDRYESDFRLTDDETLADALARYDAAARATDVVIASIDDLDQPVPVPRDAPWFPADVDAWSVRWVLLHLITETARHAGHADIVRELVDGATAFPLMAAAEGWPATAWLQPWAPKAS